MQSSSGNFYLAVCAVVPTILIGLALSTRLTRTWRLMSTTTVGSGPTPTTEEGRATVAVAAGALLLSGAAAIATSLIGLESTWRQSGVRGTTLVLSLLFLAQVALYGIMMVIHRDS
jgi:hypothetical protein